jgi:hypothetical protein
LAVDSVISVRLVQLALLTKLLKPLVQDAFWQGIVSTAQKDVAENKVKKMTDAQVLSVISSVYR